MPRPQAYVECEVMDKAVQLFWEKGYANASAKNMVDALGLNRSSIYNSFSDKKSLFLKALRHYSEHETTSLLQVLAGTEPSVDTLRTLLEHVAYSSLEKTTCKGCLVLNTVIEFGRQDEGVTAIISENIEGVLAAFTKFIEHGQQNGQISTARPAHDLAIFLFHSMTAMRVTTKIVEDRAFFKSNIETILQVFTIN